jgi:DNA-directed RNA polymerase specialized sigma24 family protein
MSPIPRSSATKRPARSKWAEGAAAHLHVLDNDVHGAWGSISRDSVDRLYGLTFARVGNRPDAEQLTAEVFRTALGPLRLGSPKGEVRADPLATAKTVFAAQWHRHLGLPVTSIDPEVDRRHLAEPADSEPPSDERHRVAKFVVALPGRYRRIVGVRFLGACAIKEAARGMEVSLGNAEVIQHWAPRMGATLSLEPDG